MNFKVGDKVRCKPGFSRRDRLHDRDSSGGQGYEAGRIIKIHEIYFNQSHPEFSVLWGKGDDVGVYFRAVEPYYTTNGILTKKEEERINKLNQYDF